MTKEDIYSQLEKLVRENTENISGLKCLDGKRLVEDLHYDSISLMALLVAMEETFGMSLDDDFLFEGFDTFDGLYEFVINSVG